MKNVASYLSEDFFRALPLSSNEAFPPSECRPASDKPGELSEVMELRLERNWMPLRFELQEVKKYTSLLYPDKNI